MTDTLILPMNLPSNLPGASLDAYVQRCHAIPMLTQEQELELARRFHDDGDLEAARQLVLSHLRFVVRVANGYAGYGLGVGDLIQEGNIGLMKAVKRFDPDVGVRLVSFAVHWIRAEMHEFIIRNWRIVKIATTKAQRKLFFNLRSQKKRLGWMNQEEVQAVADDLGVSAKDVLEMEMRLSSHDPSFDPLSDDDEAGTAPAYYLEDLRFDPAQQVANVEDYEYRVSALKSGLEQLDDRSRAIVETRWLSDDKATLQTLADRFGISAERVRQLEAAALKKLRSLLPAAA